MESKSLSKTDMIEFLSHALELEGNVYTANQMIGQLQSYANSLGKHNEYVSEVMTYPATGVIDLGKEIIKMIASALGIWFTGVCIIILSQMVISDFLLETPIIIFTLVILLGCIAYVFFLIREENKIIRNHNIFCNNRMEDQNKRNALELEQKKMLELKISMLNTSLNHTNELLNKLYNRENVYIYPKYRNVVAIAQILEYYESGRRDCLEGVNGAYDLFETELRQNIIINNLSQIQNELNVIQQNQRVLFNELQSTNDLLNSLKQEMNQFNNNINEIKINSYITTYNTMAMAKNMSAENYIKAYYKSIPYNFI